MGLHQYLSSLNDLEKIYRAPGYFKFEQHSVAAHSFRVAEVAQLLGDLESLAGISVDWRMIYEKSLNHDYTERFIGDIKTPVKYASSELRKMLSTVESSMTDNFIEHEIPSQLQATFRRRLSEGKDDSLEGKILSVADKLDLLYESFGEIQKGNPEDVYFSMFEESLTTILKFQELYSVRYFVHKILPELLAEDFLYHERLSKIATTIMDSVELDEL
ncbi:YfbR-like 5'-deoxynucleotidase [Xylocopilactobacillus apicola]|uniref:Hydrolase n=1 Tax=Xylocopilactobacillus apicola TaxID=2932184 RepID=A0AAU9DI12_9LACO|nr:YfbR-like 5'-deoxynucleotidase [Xylocopilactobacillus apicola]BDR57961.1 hydrolase [Xylocopilactobacillus apicola]